MAIDTEWMNRWVEAINLDQSTKVALKLLQAQGSRAGVARTMFRREAEALQGLHHPAIAQVYASGVAPLGATPKALMPMTFLSSGW